MFKVNLIPLGVPGCYFLLLFPLEIFRDEETWHENPEFVSFLKEVSQVNSAAFNSSELNAYHTEVKSVT